MSPKPIVRRVRGRAAFVAEALALISRAAKEAVAARGRFALALSGGNTPLPVYAAMAKQGLGVPWEAVHFFFGDERDVPPSDERSNFAAVAKVLFDQAPISALNLHPMPVGLPAPEQAVEAELRVFFGTALGEVPRFDLILLGLGPDGHTASLFPGSPALAEVERLVATVPAPETVEPQVPRLTFTLPLINAAREVAFLVAAAGKEAVLARVLADKPDASLPAALVAPEAGVVWLIEEA